MCLPGYPFFFASISHGVVVRKRGSSRRRPGEGSPPVVVGVDRRTRRKRRSNGVREERCFDSKANWSREVGGESRTTAAIRLIREIVWSPRSGGSFG